MKVWIRDRVFFRHPSCHTDVAVSNPDWGALAIRKTVELAVHVYLGIFTSK